MGTAKFRFWLVAALAIAGASVLSLALLSSGTTLASLLRDPMALFVEPGATVWWFVLGGPFRNLPTSPADIAFAAAMNTIVWLGVLWFVKRIIRTVCNLLGARD